MPRALHGFLMSFFTNPMGEKERGYLSFYRLGDEAERS